MPLTAKCLQLEHTDTSCPCNPISMFLTRRFYHSRTRIGWIVRVYTAQGKNIAIKNPIDWGRMDKDAFTIVLFVFSTQVIPFR